jgi:uncharacterized protein DUF4389
MSDATYPDVERHPIQLVVTDDLERNRLTVLFRLLLAIPHLIWAALWGIAVFFAIVVAWLAALVTGRVPDSLHGFIAAFDRYQTHVNAYFAIAADPFPAFTGAPGYPIDLDIAPAEPQNRLTVLVRLVLAIPALIVLYILQLVAQLVMILAWFYALFAGKLAKGLRDVLAYWLRYQAQTYGYIGLLTGRYPSFSDE